MSLPRCQRQLPGDIRDVSGNPTPGIKVVQFSSVSTLLFLFYLKFTIRLIPQTPSHSTSILHPHTPWLITITIITITTTTPVLVSATKSTSSKNPYYLLWFISSSNGGIVNSNMDVDAFTQSAVFKRVAEQITQELQQSFPWMGINTDTTEENPIRMLDYACGNGIVSRVRKTSPPPPSSTAHLLLRDTNAENRCRPLPRTSPSSAG